MLSADDLPAITSAYGFGAAHLTGPADRGEQGRIWRLETGDPTVWAVKETLVPISLEQARLAYALERAAAAAGVATPQQRLTVGGEVLITIRESSIRVFAWTEMAGPDRAIDAGAVGALLATLHRTGGVAEGQLHPWYREAVPEPRWQDLVAMLRRASAPFAAELELRMPDLLRIGAWIKTPPGPYVLGHRDLWADNLRRWSGTGLLVIDWDNCGPVPPTYELAMVLVEFGVEPGRAERLVQGYRDADGPGRITGPTDFTMAIATLTHILEAGVLQWLDAPDDEARDRAAGRVREFLDDPLTPQTVLDLVERAAGR